MPALFKRYFGALLTVLALGALADSVALAYPIVLKWLVDGYSNGANFLSAPTLLMLVAAVAIGGAIATAGRDVVAVKLSARFDTEVSGQVMSRLLRVSITELRNRASGEWLVTLGQIQEIKNALGILGTQAIFDLALVFGYAGLLLYYDWRAAIVYCVLASSTLFAMSRLGKSLYAAVDDGYDQKARSETYVAEALRSPLLVRAYPLADWLGGRWARAYAGSVTQFQKSDMIGALLSGGFELVRHASPLLVLAWKLPEVGAGKMSFGTALALSSVFAQGFDPFMKISTLVSQVQKALVSYRSVREILSLKEERTPGVAPQLVTGPLGLAFSGVEFNYPGGETVLRGVDFHVRPGEKVAIVGSSGAGKSTLLYLLLGLYQRTAGELALDGKAIDQIPTETLRRWVGIVTQDSELFSGSLLENIALGDDAPDLSRAQECARLANVAGFIEALPEGYETLVGDGESSVSAGQKQRIALARAIYWNPRLLLLDEPTSALDAINEREIATALPRIGENRTLVVVAHRLGTIADFDRIYVMDEGKIVEKGSHDDLLKNSGHYARLWEARVEAGRSL